MPYWADDLFNLPLSLRLRIDFKTEEGIGPLADNELPRKYPVKNMIWSRYQGILTGTSYHVWDSSTIYLRRYKPSEVAQTQEGDWSRFVAILQQKPFLRPTVRANVASRKSAKAIV